MYVYSNNPTEFCVLWCQYSLSGLPSFMSAPSFCPHHGFLPSFCSHSFTKCPHFLMFFKFHRKCNLKIFAGGRQILISLRSPKLLNVKFALIFALINWKRDPKKCPHFLFLRSGKPAHCTLLLVIVYNVICILQSTNL